MFGFAIGTLCLVGLCGVAARHHRHHAYGGGCGGRQWGDGHGPHGWRGDRWRHHRWEGRRGGEGRFREGAGRAMAEVLKRRLRVDEDQEGIVDHALSDLRASVHAFVDDLRGGRDELAGAFRGETVDEAALDALFTRWDEDLRRTRREVVSALKQVHAVLDEEQRASAADLLASGSPKGWTL